VIESLRGRKRRAWKGDVATYHVQIVNKPHRILAFQVRHGFLILLSIEYVAELIVKIR